MFGLVLEGGGTKGAYHLGAYKAICELNIPVRCIVGVSSGAINGAMFAQGDWEIADSFWEDISANDVISLPVETTDIENVFDIRHLQTLLKEIKRNKGLDISPFDKLLRSVVDEEKLRNSHIDFGLVTFNVTGVKEQQMFLNDIPGGMLVDYLLASACFPVFHPQKINNSVFVDGGVKNNMPVDMLIKAGYRDIICVEVGGIGISKRISGGGCNIIPVKCGSGSVKTLDFNRSSISEAKQLGYFDALRAFGKVEGERYYIDSSDYYSGKLKYSDKILHGLQLAAEIMGVDRLKVYKVEELVSEVVKEFKNTNEYDSVIEVLNKSDREKAVALARAIIKSDSEMLEKSVVTGLLGKLFEAASAIAYFAERDKV